MAEHNTLTGSALHEPKNIDSATTADAGKVITPSSSTAGTSVLRRLDEDELANRTAHLTLFFPDISTADSEYVVAPFDGTLTKVSSVINGAITAGDCLLTITINGTSPSPNVITIANSGSAAGDIDVISPLSNNTVSSGQAIRVQSDGGSTGTIDATLTLEFTR